MSRFPHLGLWALDRVGKSVGKQGASTILIMSTDLRMSVNQMGPNRLTRLAKTTQTAYFPDVNASFCRQLGWFGILVLTIFC